MQRSLQTLQRCFCVLPPPIVLLVLNTETTMQNYKQLIQSHFSVEVFMIRVTWLIMVIVFLLASCHDNPGNPTGGSPSINGLLKGNPNPGVLPPGSRPYGKTYGEWGATWEQWALAIPLAQSPLLDTTGAYCGVGQSGQVWFLSPHISQPVTRSCTVPAGKSIFFPIIAYINDFPCPDTSFHPAPGQTLEEFLAQGAAFFIDQTNELEVEVDGVALRDLFDYRAASRLFTFTGDLSLQVLDPCITGTPQDGVVDGYWIMLTPLPVGQHTLHFRSTIFGLEFNTTYNLTVVAP